MSVGETRTKEQGQGSISYAPAALASLSQAIKLVVVVLLSIKILCPEYLAIITPDYSPFATPWHTNAPHSSLLTCISASCVIVALYASNKAREICLTTLEHPLLVSAIRISACLPFLGLPFYTASGIHVIWPIIQGMCFPFLLAEIIRDASTQSTAKNLLLCAGALVMAVTLPNAHPLLCAACIACFAFCETLQQTLAPQYGASKQTSELQQNCHADQKPFPPLTRIQPIALFGILPVSAASIFLHAWTGYVSGNPADVASFIIQFLVALSICLLSAIPSVTDNPKLTNSVLLLSLVGALQAGVFCVTTEIGTPPCAISYMLLVLVTLAKLSVSEVGASHHNKSAFDPGPLFAAFFIFARWEYSFLVVIFPINDGPPGLSTSGSTALISCLLLVTVVALGILQKQKALQDRRWRLSIENGLSAREQDVLFRLASGQTVAAISLSLGISKGTVGTYATRAYKKLGVSSKADALNVTASSLYGAKDTPRDAAATTPHDAVAAALPVCHLFGRRTKTDTSSPAWISPLLRIQRGELVLAFLFGLGPCLIIKGVLSLHALDYPDFLILSGTFICLISVRIAIQSLRDTIFFYQHAPRQALIAFASLGSAMTIGTLTSLPFFTVTSSNVGTIALLAIGLLFTAVGELSIARSFRTINRTIMLAEEDEASGPLESPLTKIYATVGNMTNSELVVAIKLAKGESVAQIANELVVSQETVRTHRRKVYSKFGVHSQLELGNAMLVVLGRAIKSYSPPSKWHRQRQA